MFKLLWHVFVYEFVTLFTMLTIMWLVGDLKTSEMLYSCMKAQGLFFTLPLIGLLEGEIVADKLSFTLASKWRISAGGVVSGIVLFLAYMILSEDVLSFNGWPRHWIFMSLFLYYLLNLVFHCFLFFLFSLSINSQTLDDSSSTSEEPKS